MRVRWTWPASEDLTHICDYISRDNPAAALRVARTVYQGVESLQQLPQRGRNGRVTGTRELVFPGLPYVAVYEIQRMQSGCCGSSTERRGGPLLGSN